VSLDKRRRLDTAHKARNVSMTSNRRACRVKKGEHNKKGKRYCFYKKVHKLPLDASFHSKWFAFVDRLSFGM
jgi:hypothetical protein